MDDAILEQIDTWRKSAERPDAHLDFPMQGFGFPARFAKVGIREGMTLWLPSPAAKPVTRFKNGRPVTTVSDSCLDDPEIKRMRDDVLRSATDIGPGLLRVSTAFIEYAAAVVGMNYAFSDDDLSDIFTPTTWHSGMIRHLLGGDDLIDAISHLAPRMTEPTPAQLLAADEQPPASIGQDPTEIGTPPPAPRKRGRPRKQPGGAK